MNSIRLWARRVADFVGSYTIRLGGVDMIIFSAGITENNPTFRKFILDDISEALKIKVDWAKNDLLIGKEGEITAEGSQVRVLVIPTDEEVMIARDCFSAFEGKL
jgi:acetate kinase